MDLTNKVALVTGAARGIGKGCVEELLKCGAKGITIVDTNATLGEETTKEFNDKFENCKVIFVQADVTKIDSLENAFKKTVETFGNIDILVNNAGVTNEIKWEICVQVNLVGTINGILLAIDKYIPKHKSGDKAYIVNISSVAGIDPIPHCPIYTGTKQAVLGLTRTYGMNRHLLEDGIYMMALCPSKTETPMGDYLRQVIKYLDLFEEAQPFFESTLQDVDAVGRALIEAMASSQSGSAWIVENGKTYKLKFPTWNEMVDES